MRYLDLLKPTTVQLPDNPTAGCRIWYCIPGYPEKGPCRVTLLDEGWHMVQIVDNGELAWVHQCLITRVQMGNG